MEKTGLHLNKDTVKEVQEAVRKLTLKDVLVGVPAAGAQRYGLDAGPTERTDPGTHKTSNADNALLAYIHDNGAPDKNIPQREFMRPGIKLAQDIIMRYMKNAAEAALRGDEKKMNKCLLLAGIAAQRGIRQKITQGPFQDIARATALARWRRIKSHKGKSMPDSFWESARPLLDTGQLRRSITFVVRERRAPRGDTRKDANKGDYIRDVDMGAA